MRNHCKFKRERERKTERERQRQREKGTKESDDKDIKKIQCLGKSIHVQFKELSHIFYNITSKILYLR